MGRPRFGACPALLGVLTLLGELGWHAQSPATPGLQEMPFREGYFLGVDSLAVSQTLGDTTLGMLCLTVGTLSKVDPLPTPLLCFAILKSKKRVTQWGGGRDAMQQESPLCLSCVWDLWSVQCGPCGG